MCNIEMEFCVTDWTRAGMFTLCWRGVLLLSVFAASFCSLAAVSPVDSNNLLIISASARVVRVGDSVQLECRLRPDEQTAAGYTAKNITWFGGIGDEAELAMLAEAGASVNGTASSLALANVSASDGGLYRCCLTNACISPADVEILVGLLPEPASDLECYSYTFITVRCNWTRCGQRSLLESTDRLERRSTIDITPAWSNCASQDPADKCTLTRCHQECMIGIKIWEYRVTTTNDLGSVHSKSEFFDLDKHSTLKAPYDLTVSNSSASELKLRWHLPSHIDVLQSGDLKYTVEYRWEDGNWTKRKDIEPDRTSTYTTFYLKDLKHPYGLYYIRVMALHPESSIKSSYSEVVSARTTEKVPKDLPKYLNCSDHRNQNSTRHIVLSWKPPPNEFKQNGDILGYDVSYVNQANYQSQKFHAGVNATNYTIYGLDQYQTYVVNVQVRNSMGTSGNATCKKITALPKPLSSGVIIGTWVSVAGIIALVVILLCCVKSTRKFPNISLPLQLVDLDDHASDNENTYMAREVEVYDDLIPAHHRLFVDLGPEVPNGGPTFKNIITDGFDIGDKPNRAVGFQDEMDFESQPLLALAGDGIAPLTREPFLPGPRHEEDPSSGEEHGGASPSSPMSADSGGSYLLIRKDDEVVYSRLSQERLSPVTREDIEGQRLRGEGPNETAAVPGIDGFPTLLLRQEGADDAANASRGEGFDDSSTKHVKARSGSSKPSSNERTQPKKSPAGARTTKQAVGATYVGDGSMPDYVQQGSALSSAPQDNGISDSPASVAIGAYSVCGLQEGMSFPAPHNIDDRAVSPGPSNSVHPVSIPSLNQSTNNQSSAELTRGPGRPEEITSPAEDIGPYVLNTGTLPQVSQMVQDSLNSLPSPTLGVQESASPLAGPEVSNGLPATRDNYERGELNYVPICADSDSEDGDNSECIGTVSADNSVNQATNNQSSAEMTRGPGPPEGITSPAEGISPYVLSTDTLPQVSQMVQDSLNSFPGPTLGGHESASPLAGPEVSNGFIPATRDNYEMGELNYATMGADSVSEDGVDEIEQAEVNGFVAQGAIPKGFNSKSVGTVSGDNSVPGAAASGYVEQDQQPSTLLSPARQSQEKEKETVASGGFLNRGRVSDISPPSLDAPSDSSAPNNVNSRTPNAVFEFPAPDYEFSPEDRTHQMLTASPDASGDRQSGGRVEVNGVTPNPAGDSLAYVNPDCLASFSHPSPQVNGGPVRNHVDSGSSYDHPAH